MKSSPHLLKGFPLGAVLVLSACATISTQAQSEYTRAQTEVQQLQTDPLANQAAGKPLQQARDALSRAADAIQHHNTADVMHWSYLAARRAEIGEAMVAELRARNQVASATAERVRILLDSQRRRTEVAQQQARQAEQHAQDASQQLQQERQQNQTQQAQQQIQQAQQQEQQAQQQEQQAKQQLEELQARETARGMVLTLSGSLLFATGRDTVQPGAIQSLDNVARFMQQHPMMKIRVQGFTDSRGSDELNDALSQRRAQAVSNALQSSGVDPSRLQAIGRGKSLPVASNDTAAGRQQNRRVELLFSDTAGEFASNQSGQQFQ